MMDVSQRHELLRMDRAYLVAHYRHWQANMQMVSERIAGVSDDPRFIEANEHAASVLLESLDRGNDIFGPPTPQEIDDAEGILIAEGFVEGWDDFDADWEGLRQTLVDHAEMTREHAAEVVARYAHYQALLALAEADRAQDA